MKILAGKKIRGSDKNLKMQKSKLQSKINESKIFQKIVDWRVKNKFLKDQIAALEKAKDVPILPITSLSLKTQLIEFELKQLITSLDLHLAFSNRSKILKIKVKTPKEMDEKRMTLGLLSEEIEKYEGGFLGSLKENLKGLVKLRNKFVHRLFNPGSLDELIQESDKGLKKANEVIKNIEMSEKFLKENDPLKK